MLHILPQYQTKSNNLNIGEIQALKKTLNHCGLAWEPKYLSDYREINHAVWKEREENNLDLELLKIKRFALLFEKHEIKADPADYSEHYLNNLSELYQLIHN